MSIRVHYIEPIDGPIAPTAADVAHKVLCGIVATMDCDRDAVITHNLNIPDEEIAQGFPIVVLEPKTIAGRLSDWKVTASTANSITVTKGVAAGSGGPGDQVLVTIKRPHRAPE